MRPTRKLILLCYKLRRFLVDEYHEYQAYNTPSKYSKCRLCRKPRPITTMRKCGDWHACTQHFKENKP